MNKDALIQLITDYINDNESGDITPAKMREVLSQIVDSSGEGTLGEDITAIGVDLGNVTDGFLFPSEFTLKDVVKAFVVKERLATYVSPSGTISSTVSGNVEAGTTITPTINSTFYKGDSGGLTNYKLVRGDVSLYDAANIDTVNDSIQIGDSSTTYVATFSYSQGIIKNSNVGNPSPTGRIEAGTVNSNSITVSGKRYAFYDCSKPATSSAEIRSFSGKTLNPQNGTSITIEIPAGATSVVISYPADLREVTSIKHVETNYEVKTTFTYSLISVSGNNNYQPIQHRTYSFNPAGAFSSPQKYTVMI